MILLDEPAFQKLVKDTLRKLPKRFRVKLDNVEIVTEPEPAPEQLRAMQIRRGHTLLGLYDGIPQTKRTNYSLALPDKITIFQNSIQFSCNTIEELKEQVRKTVLHEIGHHFGLDDEELENT